ncbi:hypothetical protein C8J57DRAFT_1329273 [Mycena rebaudengoi]|nr:hypothetical protein C8J57DRAFT_1329273 [Mycena rebaudengoi]
MSMLTVSVTVDGQPVPRPQEVTFRVALSDDVHQMKPTVQTLSLDINPRDETQSILNLKIEAHLSETSIFPDPASQARYEASKMLAAGYDFNLRNLEESWRAVFAELLRIVLPKHVTLQEEATLWTYHDTTQNPGAAGAPLDRTLPLAKGSGYSVRPDFRAIVLRNGRMHVPVLGENKRAISRREMAPSGWPATSKGHQEFIISLQRAVSQVELQAAVLFKLDRDASDKANRQSAVFMIAAVGPIYVWVYATREEIEAAYGNPNLADIAEEIDFLEDQEERGARRDIPEPPAPTLPNAMFAESDTFQREEYTKGNSKLLRADAWSKPCMLDTPESNTVLTVLRRWEYLQV